MTESLRQLQDQFMLLHDAVNQLPEDGDPAQGVVKQAVHATLNVLEVIAVNLQRIADAQEQMADTYTRAALAARVVGK